jgi:hypothetical protein
MRNNNNNNNNNNSNNSKVNKSCGNLQWVQQIRPLFSGSYQQETLLKMGKETQLIQNPQAMRRIFLFITKQ